jgi:hypothetical protein
VRGEPGYLADLVVPVGGPMYVRAGGREARVEMASGQRTRFDTLRFRDVNARARGALEDAVRRGLFASEFGRGYYLGFIDQAPEFTPVSFTATEVVRAVSDPVPSPSESSPLLPGRLMFGGGASIAIAQALEVSPVLHVAAQPKADNGLALALDLSWAQGTRISERRATLAAGWLLAGQLGRARGWVGALVGGGLIAQTASGEKDRWSGVVAGGPVTGLSVDVTRRIGLWTEGQLWGLAYRRDGATAFKFAPGLFAGVGFAL